MRFEFPNMRDSVTAKGERRMISSPTIDPGRLEVIRAQRDAIFSSCRDLSEKIREMATAKSRAQAEIARMASDASQNILRVDNDELARKRAAIEAEIRKIDVKLDQAKAELEPLNERRQTIGQLFARCADFMGVDPNGR
ncbi:hypothetical protein O9X90_07615 [Agrobacterium leguminum]|uniref:hypothetical protein n=1 Tax=Agrobacterium leguminum TaxID=2792015 RepID=UPI0022B81BBB|nr:hypothetical protein [Agrobacterium leguminum]MCZ7932176.1 hypothetical protein [Agrobacterium leguminum]